MPIIAGLIVLFVGLFSIKTCFSWSMMEDKCFIEYVTIGMGFVFGVLSVMESIGLFQMDHL